MDELYTPERLNRVLLRVLVALGIDGLLLGLFLLWNGSWTEVWSDFSFAGLIISGIAGFALSVFLVLVVIARILVGIAYRR
ncbi:MAG TPA: hypothetical protein VF950_05565 [Planctomycetota bacterium]